MEREKDSVQRNRVGLGLILVVALGLPGCDTAQVRELQSWNVELQRQLHEQGAAREAEIQYEERQASVTLGCSILFDTCPADMTEPGRLALERGYAGSLSWPFWLMFLMKLAAISAAIGGVLGGLAVLWINAGRPAQDTVERELAVLTNAKLARDQESKMAAAAERRLRAIENQIEQLRHELSQLTMSRDEIQTQIVAREKELASLTTAIQSARAIDL